VLAVAAGLATTIVLGMAGMAILLVATYGIPLGMTPVVRGWPFLAANLAATALAGVAGGWAAASIARRLPVMHAVAVALILTALVGPSVRPRPREPVWFAHALLALALVGAVAGGAVRGSRAPRSGATGSRRA
jgi:hypothetical protein